ncbi:MAG: hypothetical protein M1814_001729 [Vezdaea aestivalis]|nr:MAG: hypothetical protein M1814_001729 [Vezdaea aestivalis]
MASPALACIGIIGKQNNPLHISLFPPDSRSLLDFSLILSSTIDTFEARQKLQTVDQDFGLLEAVDENLACYGWLTNTGVKFVAVVDMVGRKEPMEGEELASRGKAAIITGLRDSDLKSVFRALQTAYIQLLQNPFYDPDELNPLGPNGEPKIGPVQITSRAFIRQVQKIGMAWAPGVQNLG